MTDQKKDGLRGTAVVTQQGDTVVTLGVTRVQSQLVRAVSSVAGRYYQSYSGRCHPTTGQSFRTSPLSGDVLSLLVVCCF